MSSADPPVCLGLFPQVSFTFRKEATWLAVLLITKIKTAHMRGNERVFYSPMMRVPHIKDLAPWE